jgi:hypothetical protein
VSILALIDSAVISIEIKGSKLVLIPETSMPIREGVNLLINSEFVSLIVNFPTAKSYGLQNDIQSFPLPFPLWRISSQYLVYLFQELHS